MWPLCSRPVGLVQGARSFLSGVPKTLGISVVVIRLFSLIADFLCTDVVLGDALGSFPTSVCRNCHLPFPTDERTEAQRVRVVSPRSHSNFGEGNRI